MSNESQNEPPLTAAEIVQEIMRRAEDKKLKQMSRVPGFALEGGLVKWRIDMFKDAFNEKNYTPVTAPIERAFKYRCMAHAIQWIKDKDVVPSCPVKYNLMLHRQYDRRITACFTQAIGWPADWTEDERRFDLRKKIWAVVEPLRTEVLKGLVVEFIASITLVEKMKAKGVTGVIMHLVDTIKTTFDCYEIPKQKWPEGLWTPVLFAVMNCRNLKIAFAREPYGSGGQCRTFAKLLMTEIARADNVSMLKVWISRCTVTFYDQEHGGNAPDMALHVAIKHNAKKCYTYLCRLPTNNDYIRGPLSSAQRLTFVTLKHLTGTEMRKREISHGLGVLPPLLPSMLRIMWGQCCEKPAVTSFPEQPYESTPAHRARVLKSRARDYHWELVRRRHLEYHIVWYWREQAARKHHEAFFADDGQGVIVGDEASAELDAVAKSRGIEPYERMDTGGDRALALAQAKAVAAKYSLGEARLAKQAGNSSRCRDSASDSDSDSDVWAIVKAARHR